MVYLFFFWQDWSLSLGLCACKSDTVPLEPHLQFILLWLFLEMDGVSQTIYLDWPWTTILPISAFQAARITCVSHCCLANMVYLFWPSFMSLIEFERLCLGFLIMEIIKVYLKIYSQRWSEKKKQRWSEQFGNCQHV
jgi:hypothetical protein